jgi:hypothetical protein
MRVAVELVTRVSKETNCLSPLRTKSSFDCLTCLSFVSNKLILKSPTRIVLDVYC